MLLQIWNIRCNSICFSHWTVIQKEKKNNPNENNLLKHLIIINYWTYSWININCPVRLFFNLNKKFAIYPSKTLINISSSCYLCKMINPLTWSDDVSLWLKLKRDKHRFIFQWNIYAETFCLEFLCYLQHFV